MFKFKNSSKFKQIWNNKPIFILMVLFSIAFVALGIHLFRFVNTQSYDVISSQYNPRQAILAAQNVRGDIETEKGEILATTYISESAETRLYPYNNLFAHVVGYSTFGTTGIENIMNMNLVTSSSPITQKVVNDIHEQKNNGDTVVCTLNVNMQEAAYKALGVYKGAIVVTDVKTGKVLTMVSKPDFDPNEVYENWEEIVEDEKNSVLLNRATQGLYPPGSTFKIVDLLEYIREYPDDYSNFSYDCNGKFSYDNRKISCYHGMSHGHLNLEMAFAKSCNCSFAKIGTGLDRHAFRDTLNSLMFDEQLPLSLAYSQSHVSMSDETEDYMIVQSSIGQGETVMTPMHLNMITCAIANGGELMTPMLVTQVKSSEGDIVKRYSPKVYGELMTKEEANILKQYMTAVVEKGTGDFLKEADYTSAGKTGSAEYGNRKGDSHAWFTGFAPVEDPQVCVTVVIEGAGSGGDYAVPMAKRLFDKYFQEYGQN